MMSKVSSERFFQACLSHVDCSHSTDMLVHGFRYEEHGVGYVKVRENGSEMAGAMW